MAVTLKDIAKESGINVGSVSQVLNNHPKALELRPETRERIIEAANRLGYHRNELARSIVKGSSNVIAFVSSDMGAVEYTGRIQKSVFETASKLNYSVSFYQLNATNQEEIIQKILEWKIAGIIFHTQADERIQIMKAAEKNNIKVGIINHTADKLNCIGATSDDLQGAVEAVKHLTDLGHSRIAFVTCPGEVEYLRNRYEGYLAGMKRFAPRQEPEIIMIENNDFNSWACDKALKNIVDAPLSKRPTALFCAMDSLAMAFCRVAYMNDKNIPEDFSVVGFGDLEFAKYSVIPLTTIAQPFEEMSTVVTQKVIEAIKSKQSESENIKLNTELVIRQSTLKV
jgi:DNA-binding LacI/PurR family transcriptional regulator